MKRIVINGRGLGGAVNGIPRYIFEVVNSIDKQLPEGLEAELVVPEGTVTGLDLRNIREVALPGCFAWDYRRAERYAAECGALYINLGGKGVWYKKSAATIPDIRLKVFGDGKLTKNVIKTKLKFGLSYFLAVHRARALVTISKFSKQEIVGFSKVSPGRVVITPCGWEHILRTDRDDTVFEEFGGIRKKEYYLAVSSIAPHKNFGWIVENAKIHPEYQFVIVGKTDPSVWLDETESFRENVIYLGYQSDERLRSLMENAKALVFPTLYEGFGIPPLEALALGTPAVVSDIEVMREVYGDTVKYIDPQDTSADLDGLLCEPCPPADSVLKKYSWKNAGRRWLKLIDILLREDEK